MPYTSQPALAELLVVVAEIRPLVVQPGVLSLG